MRWTRKENDEVWGPKIPPRGYVKTHVLKERKENTIFEGRRI